MEEKLGSINEKVNLVRSVVLKLNVKSYQGEAHIGAQNAKNENTLHEAIKKDHIKVVFFYSIAFTRKSKMNHENFLPGIELFSQGATPQISLPLLRFTTEFEMDRSGSTTP